MTSAASSVAPRSGDERTATSVELGLALRSVVLAPEAGFRAARALTARRRTRGVRPPEGRAPYVLAGAGGAALMLLWLKVGGLLEIRAAGRADFRPGYLVAAVVTGAVLGLLAQSLWAAVGRALASRMGGSAERSDLRMVWGAASFPLVIGSLILLPLDLLLAGPAVFTADRPTDQVATAWAAVSIALGVSIAVWWGYLVFKGVQVVGSLAGGKAIWLAVAIIGCAAVVVGAFWTAGRALAGLA